MKENVNKPWGPIEKKAWFSEQVVKRSYQEEVVSKLERLSNNYRVNQYGALSIDSERYPLYLVAFDDFDQDKPTILVTGGVHGYETSGVQGAIWFMQHRALDYRRVFNIITAPCVSPWGYETINRWNPKAIDPNRSFRENSVSEEADQLMSAVPQYSDNIFTHFDLHETTDTDNTVFRPALAARDAIVQDNWDIPDGFYLVGDSNNPKVKFQRAIIESVETVTHIAPADGDGRIIGGTLSQRGVINYDTKKLGLCSGFSNAEYATTTEVYPDSNRVTNEDCINAQVAAICGGLDFLIDQMVTG